MNEKNEYYVCRRIRLYTFLLTKGFKAVLARQDREKPNYLVWLFDDTEELREAIEEYYNNLAKIINK